MSGVICINCITGTLLPGEPKGNIEKIGKYDTYVAKPSKDSSTTSQSKAIVSFTDVFGIGFKNNKIVADLLADQTGMTVYVPDLFNGNPLSAEAMQLPTTTVEAESASLLTKAKTALKLVTVVPWIYRNWPGAKMAADLEVYIKSLKQEKGIDKIGAIGFCYGGKFAVDFNTKGIVNATVACHPSFTSVGSYNNLKAPILFNCAQTDDIFTEATRKQVEANLDSNSEAPIHDMKVFENCVHGFCARPNFGDEKVKKGFEEATERSATWFKSHL